MSEAMQGEEKQEKRYVIPQQREDAWTLAWRKWKGDEQ